MSPFMNGFGSELVKLSSINIDHDKAKDEAKEYVGRKARGAAKGALRGAGVAVTLPPALALMFAARGKRLSTAKDLAGAMLGIKPRGLKYLDIYEDPADIARLGRRITEAGAIFGGLIGGAAG